MNAKEFNTAVDLYADSIFRFVVKHIRNKSLAEDVVQETFAKVWEKHSDIKAEKAKSYLFTSAYHTLIDVIKKEKRYSDFDDSNTMNTSENSHNFDIQRVLEDALDKLPEIQKSVILLRDYEGYSYEEIAEITALNESQVKVYIFRARQTLKTYIKHIELVA